MKPKPLTRPSELVLSAIYNLDEENGCSPQDIVDYITGNYPSSSEEINQKVEAALKRGLSFGLISREPSGLYKLKNIHELPEVPCPQKVRRKRRKISKMKKEVSHECSDTEVDEMNRRRKEIICSLERYKRARLESGECSRKEGAQLDASFPSANIGPRKRS